MNKYQEAFNHIVDYGVEVEYFNKQADKPEEESTIMIVSKALDKLETCIELLEKATPKKVEEVTEVYEDYVVGPCVVCDTMVGNSDNYCNDCGQRLDWVE